MLVEISADSTYYWVMDSNGLIKLSEDTIDKFRINQFAIVGGVVGAIDNTHVIYQATGEARLDENEMVYFASANGIRLTDEDGSEVRIEQNGDVTLTNGTVSILLSGGDVTISGNLDVQGTETTIDTQSLLVSDNIIEVNKNQVGTPLSTLQSGLRINRGDEEDYYILFEESSDSFVVGTITGLQAVATSEDHPNNTSIPYWNDTTKMFETSTGLVWNGSKIMGDIDTVDGLHANNNVITDNDTTLATKNKIKSYVDEKDLEIQTQLDNHEGNTGNPHSVTKTQVGLGNAPNWSGSTNASLGASNSIIPSQKAVKTYVDGLNTTLTTSLNNHKDDVNNPHSVTKAQAGLGNVPNWSGDTSTSLGTSNTKIPSQGAVKSYVDTKSAAVQTNLTNHQNLTNDPHNVTKSQVGLGSVPNWSGITSWGTPTNTQIPSAKLVKDSLDGKSGTSHTHDSRYFTETEINTKLATKSDNHTHPYSSDTHEHDWDEINTKPSSYTPSAHNQAWTTITGKPNILP